MNSYGEENLAIKFSDQAETKEDDEDIINKYNTKVQNYLKKCTKTTSRKPNYW